MRQHSGVLAIGAFLVVAVTACGGGDDDQGASAGSETTTVDAGTTVDTAEGPGATDPAGTEPAESAETARTDPTTTEATTTTMAPTTVPAIKDLIVEPVVEHPEVAISFAFSADGSTIVGWADRRNVDFSSAASLVRLDANGALVQEVPIEGDFINMFGKVATEDGRQFAYVSDYTTDSSCQLREIDAVNLALGPPIDLPFGGSCGGDAQPDDGDPNVIWVGPLDGTLVRVDLAAGAGTPIPVAGAAPAGYEAYGISFVGGNAYILAGAGFDQVTGQQTTAPDGSPLPTMLTRVDVATGVLGTPTAIPPGRVVVKDGRLLVFDQDVSVHELDLTTLAATDVTSEGLQRPYNLLTSGDTSWSVGQSEISVDIVQRDPETAAQLAIGSSPLVATDDAYYDIQGVPLGADLLVLVTKNVFDGTGTASTLVLRTRAV